MVGNILWNRRLREIEKIAWEYRELHHGDRNLLFLDFDGVINGPGFHVDQNGIALYHEDAVQRLNNVCKLCDLNIVVSSFWRHMGLEYCKNYLLNCGLDRDIPVVGTTGREITHHREREIWEYLVSHRDFTDFVILDDLDMEYLSAFHVRTNPGSCLQDRDVEELAKHFGRNVSKRL